MISIEAARYCSLRTYRRDGRRVDTPVWFAQQGGRYFVFSAGDAGKVKRLRNDSRAEVAPCDVRGRLLGDWYPARAELIADPGEIAVALHALRRKYGVWMWLTDLLARISGRYDKRAYIAFRLEAAAGGEES
ncbi:MAG: PPOX class F420-dependent oxidoreductase [Pseudomonadales bacterium]|nr:PPOX class F420-dependent oxidoreductase [Pseudomonadales bacterium]MCP5186071.1 PPOX class F420-dependent oxidoreductase [Pseudomonadales bacterium]